AYFQDPDGYGYMYHRQGSFGPGLKPLPDDEGLSVSHDADGDEKMTERFCADVVAERRPRLAVLWQCEPDHTQHAVPLGSPAHMDVIARADANVGRVVAAIRENANGDDILLIVASDHGHETVGEVIPLERLLIEGGLKKGLGCREVVVASNGFSAHVYVSDTARDRIGDIIRLLEGIDGIDRVFAGDDLETVGHRTNTALAVTVTAKRTDDTNEFGVPGINAAFEDPLSSDTRMGNGQHGGLGRFEQGPFLVVHGGGFKVGAAGDEETSAIDIAPTVLRHLDMSFDDMDGNPLSKA
ncbi:MAG: alkaline phosphatase family protein, partial [Rhodospirillales bacterium]